MSISYRVVTVGALLVLAGCGSNPHYYPPPDQTTTTYTPPPASSPPPVPAAYQQQPYGQPNPDFLVVGDQAPPGPIVKNVRVGNFCAQVTETWVPSVDPSSGTRIWLKQVSRVPAAC
jgi:hypothetical protein